MDVFCVREENPATPDVIYYTRDTFVEIVWHFGEHKYDDAIYSPT